MSSSAEWMERGYAMPAQKRRGRPLLKALGIFTIDNQIAHTGTGLSMIVARMGKTFIHISVIIFE